jgi:hypothetical protein
MAGGRSNVVDEESAEAAMEWNAGLIRRISLKR